MPAPNAIHSRILESLRTDHIDLKFLYSEEALAEALSILESLLETEKKSFADICARPDEQLDFGCFLWWSEVSYYFGLIKHYQNVTGDEASREVVKQFTPQLTAFRNEMVYSRRHYEQMKYYLEHVLVGEDADIEHTRILSRDIQEYETRGIALPDGDQDELKAINTHLADIQQTFSNNITDDQKSYEFHVPSDESLTEMPDDDKAPARERAKEKGVEGYLFDASHRAYAGYSEVL